MCGSRASGIASRRDLDLKHSPWSDASERARSSKPIVRAIDVQEHNVYIVNLESNVWLASGEGDPPRTLYRGDAVYFGSRRRAERALKNARKYRPFPKAYIAWADIND